MHDMQWYVPLYEWLVHAALVTTVIFVSGCVALLFCRQPVRRIRLIEFTMLACLVAPWLRMLPGYPEWPVTWLPSPTESSSPPRSDRVSPANDASPIVSEPESHDGGDGNTASLFFSERKPAISNRTAPSFRRDVRFWVVAAYLSGITAMTSWWLLGVGGLLRLVRSARAVPPQWLNVLREMAGPTARHVRLLMSERITQPCTVLWLRPLVVLPSQLCVQDSAQLLRWSLRHEWSHVARRDVWRWSLTNLVRVIFFYQPLVWWLRARLRLYQDYLADAEAAGQAASPEDYAEFLASQVVQSENAPAFAGLGIGGNKSDLYRRIVMLVQTRRLLEKQAPLFWTVLVGVAGIALVAVVTALRPGSISQGHIALDPSAPLLAGTAFAGDRAASAREDNEATADSRPPRILTGVGKGRLRYDQRSFEQWHDVLETDLESETRLKAIRALEAFGVNGYADESVSVISKVLNGDQPKVVSAACRALANIGSAAVQSLTLALNNDEAHVRLSAAAGLSALGPEAKDAVPALVKTTQDKDAKVRQTACDALANIRVASDAVTSALLQRLKDESPAVRLRAGSALGRIGPRTGGVIEALKNATQDNDIATKLIQEFGHYKTNGDTVVPVLIDALKSPDVKTRFAAIEALAQIGPAAKPAIPALSELLNDKSSPHQYKFLTRVKLYDNIVTVGTHAAQALEKIQGKKPE